MFSIETMEGKVLVLKLKLMGVFVSVSTVRLAIVKTSLDLSFYLSITYTWSASRCANWCAFLNNLLDINRIWLFLFSMGLLIGVPFFRFINIANIIHYID